MHYFNNLQSTLKTSSCNLFYVSKKGNKNIKMTNSLKNLAVILTFFTLSSCTKSDDSTLIYDSRTISLNEDSDYLTIKQKNSSSGSEELEYNYSWTDVKVLEIQNNNLNYNTIFFKKDDKSFETKVYIDILSNGNRNVKITNLNDDLLFSFTLDNKSIYTNFKEGIFINELDKIFSISNSDYSPLLNRHDYDPMTDCGKFSFKECMICGQDVCNQDWRCDLARTASGPAFVAGLAITCGLRQLTSN